MNNIIIMKYGVHADEKVDSIINRKQEEIKQNGYCFWGYGGVLLHPLNQVQPFCKNKEVYLLLIKTKSEYVNNTKESKYYSIDNINYKNIPSDIKVLGSKYALVFSELKEFKQYINLSDYIVGIGPSKGKDLTKYFKYRVDKACAIKNENNNDKNLIFVDYIAKLEYPYSVFVK